MSGTIRVVVADDHPIVRAGLVAALDDDPGITVVGEATDGEHAVTTARATRPDVVLMDLRMPRVGGAEATARILGELPDTHVLVVTSYDSDDEILASIEAGASGYVLKAAPAEEILEAVRRVAAGEVALAPAIAARLVARTRRRDAPAETPSLVLSARESEVLALVAAGLSNGRIGERLFIGEATVKTHLARIFDKLDVRDRTRAVTRAQELGLLPSGPSH